MSLFRRREPEPVESAFERRVLPGIPSVFRGGEETTLGEMRRMAKDMAEKDWDTPTEKGLAMSILALLDLFEQEIGEEEA